MHEHGEPITPDPPAWTRRPVLRQRWSELAYFHWRYTPDVVQRLLPQGLRVDTFDGSAWVGLIPFEMRDVQVGPTPPVPWLGSFIEINVRTYVVDGFGRRSVWFFSLDVPRIAIVAVARTAFALPYCWSDADHVVDGSVHRYRMARRRPRGSSPHADMRFRVGERIDDHDVDDLDHFLSARWGLVTSRRSKLLYGRVHHPRWPLHTVDEVTIDQNLIQAAGLPAPYGSPLARYSPGVDVEVAGFERIRDRNQIEERRATHALPIETDHTEGRGVRDVVVRADVVRADVVRADVVTDVVVTDDRRMPEYLGSDRG